jgi:hypothetical protein
MLRITVVHDAGPESASESVSVLRLEGKVLAPWVGELVSAGRSGTGGRLRLDLSRVTFADADGAAALRRLIREGAEVAACPPFIAALLEDRP